MEGKFRLVDYSEDDSGSESDSKSSKEVDFVAPSKNIITTEKLVQIKENVEDEKDMLFERLNNSDLTSDGPLVQQHVTIKKENNDRPHFGTGENSLDVGLPTSINNENDSTDEASFINLHLNFDGKMAIKTEQNDENSCNLYASDKKIKDEPFCDMSDLAFVANIVSDELNVADGIDEDRKHDHENHISGINNFFFKSNLKNERKLESFDGSSSGSKDDSESSSSASSSSISSSSDSSDSSDEEDIKNLRDMIEVCEDEANNVNPPKTKDEILLEDLPELPELKIELPQDTILKAVGVIQNLVEELIVIKALGNIPALDMETVLFKKERKPLGKIFDVFGPVSSPYYAVRVNKEDTLNSLGLDVNDEVFYAPELPNLTCYVFLEQLKKLKGSDASWNHDQEPPSNHKEFSDDEEEMKAKADAKKMRQLQKKSCSMHHSDADNEDENDDFSDRKKKQGISKSRNDSEPRVPGPNTRRIFPNTPRPYRADMNIPHSTLQHSFHGGPDIEMQPHMHPALISNNRQNYCQPVRHEYQFPPMPIPPPFFNSRSPAVFSGMRSNVPPPPLPPPRHMRPAHWRPMS